MVKKMVTKKKKEEKTVEIEKRKTIAQQVAECFNNDCFEFYSAAKGKCLRCVCIQDFGIKRCEKNNNGENIVYIFHDDSGIVERGGDVWGIKHPACHCGFCWVTDLACSEGKKGGVKK